MSLDQGPSSTNDIISMDPSEIEEDSVKGSEESKKSQESGGSY
jgi:hypothetical protein